MNAFHQATALLDRIAIMANSLFFYGDPSKHSGLTVVGKVYDSSGTQLGGDVTMTEFGTLAIYKGTMPAIAAGDYVVRFLTGSTLHGQGPISWDGSDEITASESVWLETLEGSHTAADLIRVMLAVLAGKSGISGSTVTFRDQADTKDRVTATVSGGERTAMSIDGA